MSIIIVPCPAGRARDYARVLDWVLSCLVNLMAALGEITRRLHGLVTGLGLVMPGLVCRRIFLFQIVSKQGVF